MREESRILDFFLMNAWQDGQTLKQENISELILRPNDWAHARKKMSLFFKYGRGYERRKRNLDFFSIECKSERCSKQF